MATKNTKNNKTKNEIDYNSTTFLIAIPAILAFFINLWLTFMVIGGGDGAEYAGFYTMPLFLVMLIILITIPLAKSIPQNVRIVRVLICAAGLLSFVLPNLFIEF